MKKIIYVCNICEIHEEECGSFIGLGLKENDDPGFIIRDIKNCEIHICGDCIKDLKTCLGC